MAENPIEKMKKGIKRWKTFFGDTPEGDKFHCPQCGDFVSQTEKVQVTVTVTQTLARHSGLNANEEHTYDLCNKELCLRALKTYLQSVGCTEIEVNPPPPSLN